MSDRTKKAVGATNIRRPESINRLGLVLDQQDKLPEAESLHREALAMRRKLPGSEPSDVPDRLQV